MGLASSKYLNRALAGAPSFWKTMYMSDAQRDVYFDTVLYDTALPYMNTGDILIFAAARRDLPGQQVYTQVCRFTHCALIIRRPGRRFPAQDARFCAAARMYGVPEAWLHGPHAEDVFVYELRHTKNALLLPARLWVTIRSDFLPCPLPNDAKYPPIPELSARLTAMQPAIPTVDNPFPKIGGKGCEALWRSDGTTRTGNLCCWRRLRMPPQRLPDGRVVDPDASGARCDIDTFFPGLWCVLEAAHSVTYEIHYRHLIQCMVKDKLGLTWTRFKGFSDPKGTDLPHGGSEGIATQRAVGPSAAVGVAGAGAVGRGGMVGTGMATILDAAAPWAGHAAVGGSGWGTGHPTAFADTGVCSGLGAGVGAYAGAWGGAVGATSGVRAMNPWASREDVAIAERSLTVPFGGPPCYFGNGGPFRENPPPAHSYKTFGCNDMYCTELLALSLMVMGLLPPTVHPANATPPFFSSQDRPDGGTTQLLRGAAWEPERRVRICVPRGRIAPPSWTQMRCDASTAVPWETTAQGRPTLQGHSVASGGTMNTSLRGVLPTCADASVKKQVMKLSKDMTQSAQEWPRSHAKEMLQMS